MISVSKIFEILPGHGLELCNMSISQKGIPFVNRSSKNLSLIHIYEQENQSSKTLKRHEWQAHHKQACVWLPHGRGYGKNADGTKIIATNEMLVKRAVELAKLAGREIATAQEAREILGIKRNCLKDG